MLQHVSKAVFLASISLGVFGQATGRAAVLIDEVQAMIYAGSSPDSPGDRVDDNESGSQFAGVGAVTTSGGGSIGTGVPISPYHIITAGHNVDWNNDGIVDVTPASILFRLNARAPSNHAVAKIDIHPDFDGFNSPIGMQPNGNVHDDLAVLTLSSPLPTGVPIYSLLSTETTVGQTFTMVGYGASGSGVTGFGLFGNPSVKRVGFNSRDDVETDALDEGGTGVEVWVYDFDGPSGDGELGGPTLGNDRETTVGGGDSGGAAFVDTGTELLLAGTLTFAATFDGGPDYPFFGSGGGGLLLYPYLGFLNSFIASVPEMSSLLLVGLIGVGTAALRRTRRGG